MTRDTYSRPVLLIMAAVLIWGCLHSLGAYLFNLDPRKPLIVYVCTIVFLGIWAALLKMRARRLRQEDAKASAAKAPKPTAQDHTPV